MARDDELLDPEIELHGTVGGLAEGQLVALGPGQIREVTEAEDNEIWDEHRWVPREMIDAGDRVLVLQRAYQRGKETGVELAIDTATSSIFVTAGSDACRGTSTLPRPPRPLGYRRTRQL